MHVNIHPSQWFHHEPAQRTPTMELRRLREGLRPLFHSEAFWTSVVVLAFFSIVVTLALIFGTSPWTGLPQMSAAPYYVP